LFGEVDDVASDYVFGKSETRLYTINGDHASRARDLAPFARKQPDRTQTPDGDAVALFDIRTNGAVVGGRDDVTKIQCFLVRDGVRDLEKVDVAESRPDIFGLPSGEAAREMRAAEQASKGLAVEVFFAAWMSSCGRTCW
jgi:hypothetical protein